MNQFYRSALDIAEKKMFCDTTPSALLSPRLGTGGGFQDIFLWDTSLNQLNYMTPKV